MLTVSDTPKPRVGRKPLPPEKRRSVDVRLRLTPKEADTAYQLAIKHGEPLNEVLRRVLHKLAQRAQLL